MQLTTYFIVAVLLSAASAHSLPYYKPLTAEQAERLASWTPNSLQHAWELSGQFEGDMVVGPGARNGVIDENLRWPNRIIPFEISDDFTEDQKKFIVQTLEREYARTCITVRPRNGEKDYVLVTGDDSGCWSWVGRLGGQQILNLTPYSCTWYHTIVHEFMHAAGFYHQQSSTERDDWVNIYWENIEEGQAYNFDKYNASTITNFGELYDYDSIMHYAMYAFSKNNKPTITPKVADQQIGVTSYLSFLDITKIGKMYKCL